MIIYDKNDKYLIIPTGLGNLNSSDADNQIYFEKGFDEGYEEGKADGLTEGFDNGYERGEIEGIEAYVEALPTLIITANGTYDTVNKGVNVNVTSEEGQYSYKMYYAPSNLDRIGWDEDSIKYFQYNNPIYANQINDFALTNQNIEYYGVINSGNISDYKNINNVKYFPYVDMSEETTMNQKFQFYQYTFGFPLMDTSNCTTMESCFNGCYKLISVPPFDTSSVTNMKSMFSGCSSLTSVPLFDTSSVTNMKSMFGSCSSLTSVPDFNTIKVTDLSSMFSGCSSLISVPEFDTSNVTSMESCFSNCLKISSAPDWDYSNVSSMGYMFYSCNNLTSVPDLNTSKCTDMRSLFYNCQSFTDVGLIDATSLTDTYNMFEQCRNLTNVAGFLNLKASIDLHSAYKLTYYSVKNIAKFLYNFTDNGETPNANQGVIRIDSDVLEYIEGFDPELIENGFVALGWTLQG